MMIQLFKSLVVQGTCTKLVQNVTLLEQSKNKPKEESQSKCLTKHKEILQIASMLKEIDHLQVKIRSLVIVQSLRKKLFIVLQKCMIRE